MELDYAFSVPVPPDQAWGVLLDVERIWPCMPGVTIDEFAGEVVAGRIKIKVGPLSLTYSGTAKFTTRDQRAKLTVIEASGKETRGAGTASATVRAGLKPEPNGQATKVSLHITMDVTGRPAQFGRGVITEVGGKLVEQFAQNLAQELATGTKPGTAGRATSPPASQAPTRPAGSAGNSTPPKAAGIGTVSTGPPPASQAPSHATGSAESSARPRVANSATVGAADAPSETPSYPSGHARIFISYRREDGSWPAGWLYDRLASHFGQGNVFKDVDTIQLGDDFVEKITQAVGACEVLLAVIGSRWLTVTDKRGRRRLDDPADFVRLEIEAALERGVRIIPVLVDGASMPSADELPTSMKRLTRRQALVLSPDRFDTSRLLKVLNVTLASRHD